MKRIVQMKKVIHCGINPPIQRENNALISNRFSSGNKVSFAEASREEWPSGLTGLETTAHQWFVLSPCRHSWSLIFSSVLCRGLVHSRLRKPCESKDGKRDGGSDDGGRQRKEETWPWRWWQAWSTAKMNLAADENRTGHRPGRVRNTWSSLQKQENTWGAAGFWSSVASNGHRHVFVPSSLWEGDGALQRGTTERESANEPRQSWKRNPGRQKQTNARL